MKIGQKVKKMRELRNLTQDYMAEKMAMSQSGYSKIEQDETDVPFSRLLQIAKILDVNILDLLSFEGDKLFFNISNQHNQNGSAFFFGKEEGKELYEKRIADLQNEITFLREMLEKAVGK